MRDAIATVKILLGHSKLESTVSYLGIEVGQGARVCQEDSGAGVCRWIAIACSDGRGPANIRRWPYPWNFGRSRAMSALISVNTRGLEIRSSGICSSMNRSDVILDPVLVSLLRVWRVGSVASADRQGSPKSPGIRIWLYILAERMR